MTPARVAVLLSGRGSNFLALREAVASGDVPAEIVLVLSNQPDAPGLAKAAGFGLPTASLPHRGLSRREHEERVVEALRDAGAEWVCLAGYMRILTPCLIDAFPRRIVNVHPSLLPAFPGLDAQRQAWDYGVKVSGCTVHLVDHGVDTGPIVMQAAVDTEGLDSADELASRILKQEHRLYPRALRRLLAEPWRIDGRRVVFGISEKDGRRPRA